MQHRLPRRVVVLVNVDADVRDASFAGDVPRMRSLQTAQAVLDAVRALDVEVSEKRITSSLSGLVFQIGRAQADVVFNLVDAIQGDAAKAWQVPALLGRHRIAYTGNAALPLRICLQKDKARRALSKERVPVAANFGAADSPMSVWIFPDPIAGYAVSRGAPSELQPEVEALAYKALALLGGTGYGRVDLTLDANGKPCVSDVRPNCDLHPEGELSEAAKSLGWQYQTLIASLLTHAMQTHERQAIDERSQL